MAFPYALYGGATRPDAISGLSPAFTSALMNLYAGAPPEVQRELGLNSAYRSPETQARLFNASDRSGHTVAAPGKSRHNFGEAVDLYGFGLKGAGNVSQATRDWVQGNAARFGLSFPMSYEPWHLQLAKGQAQGSLPPAQENLPDVFAGSVGDQAGDTGDPLSALVSSLASRSPGTMRHGGDMGLMIQDGGVGQAPQVSTPDANLTANLAPANTPRPLPLPAASLADLFKVKDIGQAGAVLPGMAAPTRRF